MNFYATIHGESKVINLDLNVLFVGVVQIKYHVLFTHCIQPRTLPCSSASYCTTTSFAPSARYLVGPDQLLVPSMLLSTFALDLHAKRPMPDLTGHCSLDTSAHTVDGDMEHNKVYKGLGVPCSRYRDAL